MSAAADIFTVLTGDIDLAAIIEDRAYPQRLPHEAAGAALPCIVYIRISQGRPDASQDSAGRLRRVRWQLDCWAPTHQGAEELGDATEAALAAAGKLDVEFIDRKDGPDLATGLRREIVEAYCWHDESEGS